VCHFILVYEIVILVHLNEPVLAELLKYCGIENETSPVLGRNISALCNEIYEFYVIL
jgi:hypothetical protein